MTADTYHSSVLRGSVRDERGAVAVEMTVLMVVLVPLMLGIIAFGAVMSQKISLDNAVRQAARAAVVQGAGETTSQAACTAVMNGWAPYVDGRRNYPIFAADVQPEVTVTAPAGSGSCPGGAVVLCEGSDPGDTVRIDAELVTSPLDFISVQLRSTAVYQCEFS